MGDSRVCIGELKLGFIAQNCIAPSFCTLLTNTLICANDKSEANKSKSPIASPIASPSTSTSTSSRLELLLCWSEGKRAAASASSAQIRHLLARGLPPGLAVRALSGVVLVLLQTRHVRERGGHLLRAARRHARGGGHRESECARPRRICLQSLLHRLGLQWV